MDESESTMLAYSTPIYSLYNYLNNVKLTVSKPTWGELFYKSLLASWGPLTVYLFSIILYINVNYYSFVMNKVMMMMMITTPIQIIYIG